MSTQTPSPRQQHWANHVSAWQGSHLTQNAYCQEHQLKPSQFSYWKHKLTSSTQAAQDSSEIHPSPFIPVTISEHSQQGLTLHLPNGYRVSGIEAQHLTVIKELAALLS